MNFADNWARVFVVITFLTFGDAQIIGGIVPNLIAFGLFLGAIGYFASTGKMAEMFCWKNKNKVMPARRHIAKTYGPSPTTVNR